jgi:hypothetical protein
VRSKCRRRPFECQDCISNLNLQLSPAPLVRADELAELAGEGSDGSFSRAMRKKLAELIFLIKATFYGQNLAITGDGDEDEEAGGKISVGGGSERGIGFNLTHCREMKHEGRLSEMNGRNLPSLGHIGTSEYCRFKRIGNIQCILFRSTDKSASFFLLRFGVA